jgi:ribA/ribD-fused uncharacterized protein
VTDKISFFYGEYRFLSNFWYVDIEFEGLSYPSVEHAYVAAKTLDQETRKIIQQVETPGQVKRVGRSLVLRDDWDEVKLDLMLDFTRQKFASDPLKTKLLQTGHAYLEEGNSWNDTFWGVCNNVGANHLGKILMQVREELNKQL